MTDGLSKESFKEVKNIIDDCLMSYEKSDSIRWESIDKFKRQVYDRFDKIDRTLITVEFKHNWKTAMWVFIGSLVGVLFPTSIAFIIFFWGKNG